MKKTSLYLSIFVFPFLMMIIINEVVRVTIKEKGYTRRGVTAINSAKRTVKKCTWICHNDTEYCKSNHVKLTAPHFDKIDPVYFGIIHSLKSTGNYKFANILFLVILIPLMLFFLLVKSIDMEFQIRKLKE